MDDVAFEDRPALRDPVLVCAFAGWNDGGEAATGALNVLRRRWHARRIASIDPEGFFDFQVNRPTVRLLEGVSRRIDWPASEFFHAALPGRDVVLFIGIEPNVRWRTFADTIVGTARELGVRQLITLGGFLADLPHTRAVRVTGSAASEEEAERLGMAASRYEGPTGIVGVLHDASNRAGLPSVSLWAAVPHYLPAGPNPGATLALIQRLSTMLDVPGEVPELEKAAMEWRERVDRLVAESDELREYVGRLEAAADLGGGAITQVPTGEELATELERFLREQGDDER